MGSGEAMARPRAGDSCIASEQVTQWCRTTPRRGKAWVAGSTSEAVGGERSSLRDTPLLVCGILHSEMRVLIQSSIPKFAPDSVSRTTICTARRKAGCSHEQPPRVKLAVFDRRLMIWQRANGSATPRSRITWCMKHVRDEPGTCSSSGAGMELTQVCEKGSGMYSKGGVA